MTNDILHHTFGQHVIQEISNHQIEGTYSPASTRTLGINIDCIIVSPT